jgi:hypothetical protein
MKDGVDGEEDQDEDLETAMAKEIAELNKPRNEHRFGMSFSVSVLFLSVEAGILIPVPYFCVVYLVNCRINTPCSAGYFLLLLVPRINDHLHLLNHSNFLRRQTTNRSSPIGL